MEIITKTTKAILQLQLFKLLVSVNHDGVEPTRENEKNINVAKYSTGDSLKTMMEWSGSPLEKMNKI